MSNLLDTEPCYQVVNLQNVISLYPGTFIEVREYSSTGMLMRKDRAFVVKEYPFYFNVEIVTEGSQNYIVSINKADILTRRVKVFRL